MIVKPIEIKVTEMETFGRVLHVLRDAYEALCSARSEGWDVFSDETRAEVCEVMDRIMEVGSNDA